MKKEAEDVYAPSFRLHDFFNEMVGLIMSICSDRPNKPFTAAFTLKEARHAISIRKMQTVEQRYLLPGGSYYYPGDSAEFRKWKAEIANYPLKVSRINAVVGVINDCKNLTDFKRAMNELNRLLYGKSADQYFKGSRFDPDKLKI
ncbi:MAG: hypothetical protein WC835_03745 [Candidatus Paceibacterota bacterium]|jgi:hypothetical protein